MVQPYLGQISMVGFNFAPVGWALCNGQLMNVTQNNALFALLGTTYGGNGTSTFGLPNLQSRAPVHVGVGQGLTAYQWGEMTGTETNTLLTNNLPAHTHTVVVQGGSSQTVPINGGTVILPALSASGQMAVSASGGTTSTPSATAVPAQASVTLPPPNGTKAVNAYGTADAVTKFPVTITSNYGSNQTIPVTGTVTVPAPTISIGLTGGNIPVNNIQPVLAVYFVIALTGMFPSRG